jgi:hypothetical protein
MADRGAEHVHKMSSLALQHKEHLKTTMERIRSQIIGENLKISKANEHT